MKGAFAKPILKKLPGREAFSAIKRLENGGRNITIMGGS